MPSTVAVRGAWSLQSTNNAYAGRLHDGSLLMQANTSIPNATWRSGVLPSVYSFGQFVDLLTVQNGTPSMAVIVGPGSAVIGRSAQAAYLAYSDANATLTVATADPTNPRIDLVYLQVLDTVVGDASTVAQVGIVTGTPAPSPSVPPLPLTGACIPLAQVAVAANATSIVTGNISQVRKSAGLRGAVRPMLEGDLLTDVGYGPGELRSRYSSSYSQTLIDYWGTDAAWHGTQTLSAQSPTWQNGTSNITIGTSKTGLVKVSIPDPGWSYYLRVSAQIDWNSYGTFTAGSAPYVLLYAALDTVGGAVIGTNNGFAQNAANIFDAWSTLPRTPPGAVLSGAHSVYLVGQGSVSVNAPYAAFASATYLSVDIVPA